MRWQLASTLAAMAMFGCYEEATVPCPDGVLCPADQACTGNAIGAELPLCGDADEVAQCAGTSPEPNGARPYCETSMSKEGVCENNLCTMCEDEFFDCHYSDWRPLASPVDLQLRAIHVAAENRAYAVGTGGTALTYDGLRWSEGIDGVTLPPINEGVWTIGVDVMVVGDQTVRTNQGGIDVPASAIANGVWGDGNTLIAVGSSEVTGRYDGVSWSWNVPSSPFYNYRAVWGWSGGATAIVVGDGGVVQRWNNGAWTSFTPAPPSSGMALTGVWGVSEMDFFVVGYEENGPIPQPGVILRYANGTWTNVTPSGVVILNGIWGSGPTDVYAVGASSTILHFDGVTWSRMDHTNPSVELTAISGFGRDAMVVSGAGTIWRISPR